MRTRAFNHDRSRQPHHRRGFTLVELMVSIAMFAILAIAIQSTVLLATRAIPSATGVNVTTTTSAKVLDELNAELSYALSFTEMTSTAVTFTVGDRDGDLLPETIRYAWSGVAGEPLTRQYNGGDVVNVLSNVQTLALAFDRRSVLAPVTFTESAESQLFSSSSGLLPGAFGVDYDEWCGQYFVPTLPNGIDSWRVTRVQFIARRAEKGKIRVQLRAATPGGLPTAVIVAQTPVDAKDYGPPWAWQEISFVNASGLTPGAGYCLVFRGIEDDDCDIQYAPLTLAVLGGPKYFSTSNSGASYTANTLRTIPMRVYGKTSTRNPDSYLYYVTNVRVEMRSGTDVAAAVSGNSRVLAEPQVNGP